MEPCGIVRRFDRNGRIVPPMEMRLALDIGDNDPVEFTLEGDGIVIRKYHPSCAFCGTSEELTEFKGRYLCATCKKEIAEK